MGKKFNQNLLNEELKKFKLLSEYTFYTEEPKKDDNLILGSDLDEADEDPNADPNAPAPADDSKTAANAAPNGGPNPAAPPAGADAGVAPDPNAPPVDPNAAPPAAATDAAMASAPDPSATPDSAAPDGLGDGSETGGDEVDVDVTDLVQKSEEATQAATQADVKSSELLNKFSELERRVSSMDALAHKIDTLEKEIVKRNPTPVEKLEMRSMDSYPYNIKLSDYFKEVDGEATPDTKAPEYVLRKDDVDSKFVDSSVKKSFSVPDDYDEEEID